MAPSCPFGVNWLSSTQMIVLHSLTPGENVPMVFNPSGTLKVAKSPVKLL